jgi:MinD-like ATPase involved in chromosome partitioning or flagellar assembly
MIVCWSAKGGSGTTVVAAALAITLAERSDAGVTMVDAAGDVPAALGAAEPGGLGLGDWLADDAAPPESVANLVVACTGRIGVVPRGTVDPLTVPAPPGRLAALATALQDRTVVVDAGSGAAAHLGLVSVARTSLLVVRPCYLALRRAVALGGRADGVVLLVEPGRALGRRDVESVLGAPVVAEVPVEPSLARAVDAGLLATRIPRSMSSVLGRVA